MNVKARGLTDGGRRLLLPELVLSYDRLLASEVTVGGAVIVVIGWRVTSHKTVLILNEIG